MEAVESEMVDFMMILIGGKIFVICLATRHAYAIILANIRKHCVSHIQAYYKS